VQDLHRVILRGLRVHPLDPFAREQVGVHAERELEVVAAAVELGVEILEALRVGLVVAPLAELTKAPQVAEEVEAFFERAMERI